MKNLYQVKKNETDSLPCQYMYTSQIDDNHKMLYTVSIDEDGTAIVKEVSTIYIDSMEDL